MREQTIIMFWIRFTGSVWAVFFLLVLGYENILLPSGLVNTRLGLGDPLTGLGAVWIALLLIPGISLIWLGRGGNPILKRFLEGLANDLKRLDEGLANDLGSSGRNIGRSAADRDGDIADPIMENSSGASTRSDGNARRGTASRGGDPGGRGSKTLPPLRMKAITDAERRFSMEVPADWDELFSLAEGNYGLLDNSGGFGMVSIERHEPEDLEEGVTTLSEYADYCVNEDMLEGEEEISREYAVTSQGLLVLRIETHFDDEPSSLKLLYLADDLTGICVDCHLVGDEDMLRRTADYSFSTFRDAFDT